MLPSPVFADSIHVVLEKTDKKGTTVVVERQVWDHDRGFDAYILETFAVPQNKKLSSRPLAPADRTLLAPHGQLELYMKRVAAQREKEMARFKKKGFVPVCTLHRFDVPGRDSLALPAAAAGLAIRVEKTGKMQYLTLEKTGGKAHRMMKFKPAVPPNAKGKDRYRFVRRDFMEVVMLEGGKHLAVVLRRQTFPSAEAPPDDDLYFLPLKRPLSILGIPWPLETKP